MEHIEEAGIHSGDSACSLPPYSPRRRRSIAEIERQTEALARALDVVGLMNVQFAVKDGDGLRARGQPARLPHRAVRRQGDRRADRQDRRAGDGRRAARRLRRSSSAPSVAHVAVKEAVFPFARFPGVDLILGPEMKSTGEVMGLDADFGRAFAKSQLGAGTDLPLAGHGLRLGARPRQGGAGRAVPPARRDGLRAGRDARHRARCCAKPGCRSRSSTRCWRAGRTSSTRCERRRPAGLQHHRGRAGDRRQLQPAPHRADPQHPLLHDRRRRPRRGPGDRGAARGQS